MLRIECTDCRPGAERVRTGMKVLGLVFRGDKVEAVAIARSPLDTIIARTRERAGRILAANYSNSAKALARDALELCELVDDFRSDLIERRAREPEATSTRKGTGSCVV